MLLPLLRPVQKSASRLLLAGTNAAFDFHEHGAEPQLQTQPPVLVAQPGAQPVANAQPTHGVATSQPMWPTTQARWADFVPADEQPDEDASESAEGMQGQPVLWPLAGPFPAGTVMWPMLLPMHGPADAWNTGAQEAAQADQQWCEASGSPSPDLEYFTGTSVASAGASRGCQTPSLPSERSCARTGASRRQRRKQRNAGTNSALRGAPSAEEVEEMRVAVERIQRTHLPFGIAAGVSSAKKPACIVSAAPTGVADVDSSGIGSVSREISQLSTTVPDGVSSLDMGPQFWPPTPESTPPHSPYASPRAGPSSIAIVETDPLDLGEEASDLVVAQLTSGDKVQNQALLSWITTSAWPLASTPGGCRVVQQALEISDSAERAILVGSLQGHVQEASVSPHGNHVLQKCITVMPPDRVQFVLNEMQGYAITAARHRYGCRVLERLIEHCPHQQTSDLIEEVLGGTEKLCRHAFGNFVVQHILEHGTFDHRRRVAEVLLADTVRLAKHRVASHVVKSALVHCSTDDRQRLTHTLSADVGELSDLAHHHCGSFVVREMRRAALTN